MKRREYIAAADVLRVGSIALVACFHIWQQSWWNPSFTLGGRYIDFDPLLRHGYMGVDLLLLLSGFLLYYPWAKRGEPFPDTLDFYKKRLIRILPCYLLAVGLAFVNALVCGRNAGSAPLWKDLLAHLTFTHTFFARTYLWTSLNGALWTLCIEMQFYLIFPLVARAFYRKPALTFGIMTALALLVRLWVMRQAEVSVLFNQLPCMLDLYAFGMLAAHFLTRNEKNARPGWGWALLSAMFLAGIIFVLYAQHPKDNRDIQQLQMLWRLPLAVLGAGFLYCGARWPQGLCRALGSRVTRFLAAISYNFYMWHQFLAVKLKDWHIPAYVNEMPQMNEGRPWQIKYTVLCFVFALAAATLATYLVEKPAARALQAPGKGRSL